MIPRLLIPALVVAAAAGCGGDAGGGSAGTWKDQPGPKVVASFAPIYSLAATVAGPDAQVACLMTETGPHDYQYGPKDAVRLSGATHVFALGLGMDDAVVGKMTAAARFAGSVRYFGRDLPKDLLREGECDHDHAAGEAHDHDHTDPHVWLGAKQSLALVDGIAAELAKADPAHAAGYRERATALTGRLTKLHVDYAAKFKAKQEKNLLSFHDSLYYFAESYGLKVVAHIEPKPGIEPTTPKLKEVVKACAKDKVRLIATEPQYSSQNSARVILDELKRADKDAAFVEVDPMETCPKDAGADYYEKVLVKNLEALEKSLR